MMDFGIARSSRRPNSRQTGTRVGPVLHVSGADSGRYRPDARSSLYSVGVVALRVGRGQGLSMGESQFAIMSAHLLGTPVPPSRWIRGCRRCSDDVILMAVAKDANARSDCRGAAQRAVHVVSGPKPAAAAAVTAPLACSRAASRRRCARRRAGATGAIGKPSRSLDGARRGWWRCWQS